MEIPSLHVFLGWTAMLAGAVSGAVLGLFFHRDDWAGGYDSFKRRMLRLGHISFFGIGFLNLLFGLTLSERSIPALHMQIASLGFVTALVTMPLCCFLTAWKKRFRFLFPIPVLGVMTGVVPILLGWKS